MDKMKDLKALLKHDVQLLHSVEEQIIAALPAMIERQKMLR
jgi:ferritin-like metal-binding protein YciE